MKILKLVVKPLVVTTYFATYIPLITSGVGIDMWHLTWQWWVAIFFTIFSISMGFIWWELELRIKKLESKDKYLEREERKLKIKNGLFDFWQKTLQSEVSMPDDLKKKIDELS